MPSGRSVELADDEVHVWIMPVRAPEAVIAGLERVLSEDELEQASRFRFPHLRDSYIVSHGVLRHLLARYLDQAPADIAFVRGAQGKPAVSPSSPLQFNLTHSGGMAAVALANGCAVGIDLEHLRPMTDIEEIAGRYFCPEEAAEILALPPDKRDRAFFSCWTRKEAYIKAIGDGLSCPLDSFQVTIQPNTQPRLVHIAGDTGTAAAWTLHDLSLAPDHIAALAYRDQARIISIFPIEDFSAFAAGRIPPEQ
jgi:4'-phosphopantetheinyl transferase